MAWLRKLLKRGGITPTPLPAGERGRGEGPPDVAEAIAELGRLRQQRASLAPMIAFLTEALPHLFADPVREVPPPADADAMRVNLAAGRPAWTGLPLPLDEQVFHHRWQ